MAPKRKRNIRNKRKKEYYTYTKILLRIEKRIKDKLLIKFFKKTIGITKKKKFKKETEHHKTPRSRGGKDEKKIIDELTHICWHRIFLNWTPKEIIKILKVCGRNAFIRNNLGLKSIWAFLFQEKTDKKIIKVIKNEWS